MENNEATTTPESQETGTEAVEAPAPTTLTGAPLTEPEIPQGTYNAWDNLSDDLKQEPSLRNFMNSEDPLNAVAKSYVHAVKKMGVPPEQMIRLPKEGEPMDDVYSALGRPDNPSNYSSLPDSDDFKPVRDAFYETGLTDSQAKNVLDIYMKSMEEVQEEQTEQFEKERVQNKLAIQQEWGADYQRNANLAQRAFNQFAPKEAISLMEETGIGEHPAMLKMFSNIGSMLAEDNMLAPADGQFNSMSPVQAQVSIKDKQADPEFMKRYMDAKHPGHNDAVKEMKKLYELT